MRIDVRCVLIAVMEFGQEIRRRRLALNMTLEQLAYAAGLTPNYIAIIESGHRDPSLSTVMALAKGLKMKPAELFGGIRNLSAPATEAGLLFDGSPDDVQDAVLALLRSVSKRKVQTRVGESALLATGTDGGDTAPSPHGSPRHNTTFNIRNLPMPDLSTEERLDVREEFQNILTERLEKMGWTLASLSLGRTGRDIFLWNITLKNVEGVLVGYRIQLAPGAHAYADSTIETIMGQIPDPAALDTSKRASDAR